MQISDYKIKRKLERAYWLDQTFRQLFLRCSTRFLRLLLSMLIWGIDKFNQKTLVTVLKTNSWPLHSIHGEKAATAAYFILQHSPQPIIELYFPLLKEAVCRFEANSVHLATTLDRLLMYRGKKQIYGTQIMSQKSAHLKTDCFWPIVNPEKVNQRRRCAGFTTTLEEYALKNRFSYKSEK